MASWVERDRTEGCSSMVGRVHRNPRTVRVHRGTLSSCSRPVMGKGRLIVRISGVATDAKPWTVLAPQGEPSTPPFK
jgi:hypothetical protein